MSEETRSSVAKYFARSFLLPLAGLCGVFYLAYKFPAQWDKLWIPGLLMAAFAGVFSLQDAVKQYIEKMGK